MTDFLSDSVSWILISFIIFVALAFKFGRQSVVSKLDAHIESVRKEIATAEALKAEAQALLSQYQLKQQDAMREVDAMVSNAKLQAETLQRQAEEDFASTMARKEVLMKERLQRMEETAMDDIRRYAADLAVSATARIIAEKMDENSAQKLADASIGKIADNLN